jgi:hypothetical protein
MRRVVITAAAGMLVGAAPLAGTAAPAAHASPGDCSKLQGLLQAGGVSEGPGWVAQCNAAGGPSPAPDAGPPASTPGTQIAGAGPPTGDLNSQLFPNINSPAQPEAPIRPVITPQQEQKPWEPSQYPGGPRLNPPTG